MKQLLVFAICLLPTIIWGQNNVSMSFSNITLHGETKCYQTVLTATCVTEGGCEVYVDNKLVKFVGRGKTETFVRNFCFPRQLLTYSKYLVCKNCRTDEYECKPDGCTVTVEGKLF